MISSILPPSASLTVIDGEIDLAFDVKLTGGIQGRIDDNELITRYKTDPIMGGTGMNVNFVTFLRAADVEAQVTQEGEEGAQVTGAEEERGRGGRRVGLNEGVTTGVVGEVVS